MRSIRVWQGMVGAWLACWAMVALATTAPDFADIVARTSPAVVNISAVAKIKTPAMTGGTDSDDIQDFLRRFYGLDPQQSDPQPRSRQVYGSGFIISPDGYVLTNNHVIDGADKVTVRLSDRRELEAKVIGSDPRTDIALLKIDAHDLPTLKIGNPADLRVGDWVLAIGSPFGFDYSATAGIVSAKSRSLPDEAYVPFIQTDVAINPGNSGGPLFNAAGEVIGINSQIYSRSGGFMGLSFAIPVDVAMDVVSQLRQTGKVDRGWLGVTIQEVTRDLADAYGLPRPAGALVTNVDANSPASKAGLREGDIVTRFNGRDIDLSAELPQAIGRARVGSDYAMTVFRERKPVDLTVHIEAMPEDQAASGSGKAKTPDLARLGLTLRDLKEAEKAQLSVKSGTLVVAVGDGVGEDAGLRPGDVITRVGDTPVHNTREFAAAVRRLAAGQAVALVISRGGNNLILALKPDAQDLAR